SCSAGPAMLRLSPATRGNHALALHAALPTYDRPVSFRSARRTAQQEDAQFHRQRGAVGAQILLFVNIGMAARDHLFAQDAGLLRSEEHTSELQSRENIVCRLLLENKDRQLMS